MAIRLNRYLSESGFCSRREADGIIAEGRVTVNGVHGEYHSKVTPEDVVAIDGERVMPRRKIDFTPKEAPKPHRSTRREPEKQPWVDKVPQWLKEIREKKPDLTPQRALVEKKETSKPKPKVTTKPSASKSKPTNSKKYTPKKKFNQ